MKTQRVSDECSDKEDYRLLTQSIEKLREQVAASTQVFVNGFAEIRNDCVLEKDLEAKVLTIVTREICQERHKS